ncbi:cellulase family glycosylhydrolase [Flavobacterium sp. JAS]|uniref:cellulase family glycosylhydrolase n=1 Tax=Flavobacterium sp. JAS TaxID=2897329 RepID=UPI001E592475|nr:cellulase family glycosylhydrolase [Flavobacterium sp. JAS]MCD0469969.1 cellulase family glycosylhydrolase [Flavobacterium sp. JAS]
MKFKHFYKIVLLLIVAGFSVSCSKNEEEPQLTVSAKIVSFEPAGGTSEDITIEANSAWSLSNSAASWLQLTTTSGSSGATTTKFTALSNETGFTRSVVLTVEANNGQARRITITQRGNLYPTYNLTPKAPDETGMSSTAMQLSAKMHLGINFGNTMEAPTEAEWVNSKITESYVKFIKEKGFNSVRIPCGWVWTHLSDPAKAKIDPAWLNRVKEVVGWCVDNDMYVILNAHADNGWLDNNITKAKQESINAMQKAIWEQIATTMRDFDEHLIFAGANEPPADDAEKMAILNGYYETFIKAVRATGGKNSYRVLVVQGPRTDAALTFDLMNTMPTDNIPNKLMVEVHNYTPALFTIVTDADVSWGKMIYYWGAGNHSTIEPERNATFGEEDVIDSEFQKMKQKFVDKGIPVILGEYATWRRTPGLGKPVPKDMDMHNKSVNYWSYYVTKQAKANGIVPFWWEIGFMLDRANDKVKDQAMLDAIIEGGK